MERAQIDCYIDFSCPWSYIGLLRLQDAADRHAAQIILKPVSVKDLLRTENPNISPGILAENPAKARWQVEDLRLWGETWGISLKIHEKWPFDAKISAAAFLLASPDTDLIAYALAIFSAHFSAGKDTTDVDVLAVIAAKHQVDAVGFRARIEANGLREQVADYTEELIRRGGFGTPSMFLDSELFFGNDRIPLLEWRLGPMSDLDFVMPGQHGPPDGIEI
jgi:2-hydroxychromene-2-carboxylate isomerase